MCLLIALTARCQLEKTVVHDGQLSSLYKIRDNLTTARLLSRTATTQRTQKLQRMKALRGDATLRAGCSKAEPKKFALPGGAGRPKFNQLEIVATFTYKPSLVRMHAISSYHGNRPTTHTNTPPARPFQTRADRTGISRAYTAPLKPSAQCN